MIEFKGKEFHLGDVVEYYKGFSWRGLHKPRKAVVVLDPRNNNRYGLKLLHHTNIIAKFHVNITKIDIVGYTVLRQNRKRWVDMKDYDINKFPHYQYSVAESPCIGCCCQCKYHKAVASHPWHNGKPMSNNCAYVCTYTEGETESFTLSSEHGTGCECFYGNEEWELYLDKVKVIRKLQK
jgi:hypothetical protein